jgi:ABC-type Zn uptake system ZnuABC Zn-binding protein ZnuA
LRASSRRIIVALFAALALQQACAATISVVTATSDLASLARAVGGDLVQVQSIAPAGSDAESYESRPGDLQKIRDAQLVVRVGLGYDYWLDALVRRTGNARVARGSAGDVDASLGIPLLDIRGQTVVNEAGHAHGVANPHYWLDPENARIATANIAEHLIALVPDARDRIIAARSRFLAALDLAEQRWRASLAPFAGTAVIAYHDAWPYFARRFRLDVVGFIEPKPGIAPTPAHLRTIVDEAGRRKVRAVIHDALQPQDASRFVARALGVPMVTLAVSAGSMPGTADYLDLIDANVAALARALSGAPAR